MTKYFFKTLCCCAVLILLFTSLMSAQTTPRVLRLEEVVQLGMANSKQLKASMARAEAAHAKTEQARATTIPSLTYNGSYARLSDNIEPFSIKLPNGTEQILNPVILNQYTNRFAVSEPVFTGFRAVNTIKATRFLENAARFDLEKDKKDLQLNLMNAALNLYKLQEAGKVFERSLVSAQNRLTDIRNLNKQGIALDNDVLKADLAVTQLETAQIETTNGIAAAQFVLNTLLGLDTGTTLQIDPASIPNETNAATLDQFLTGATQRADYQSATQRALASEKQILISKGTYLPLISVGANLYANNPNQRQFPSEASFLTTWDAGVQLSWNLSNLYTSRFAVQEAKLNAIQSGALRDQVADAARQDIATNFYNWQSARQKIVLSDKAVLQATENQRISNLRSEQQLSSVSELLDADTLLIQTQINQLSARADAYLAWLKLLKSAGQF